MKEKNQEFKSAQGSFPVVHLFDLTSTASTSFFSVQSRSLQTKCNRYPDVGIGRKQRKKELEEHHSDPAVLPMAFKYLI